MSDYPTQLFINGKYVDAKGGETLDVINPATEELFTKVSAAQKEDVDIAVDAAEAAFPAWSKTAPSVRASILRKFGQLLKDNADVLGPLESQAMGVPTSTFHVTVDRSKACLDHCAALALLHLGQSSYQGTPGFFVSSVRQPLGVVAGVIAWNVSLLLACFKLGPALAAGNTMVLKSSEKSPVAIAYLGKLANEAGFPPGVLNIITGYGLPAGQRLAEHPKVRKISFTGSAATGKRISATAANTNLKRVTLELGGKGPSIVFPDADIEKAAKMCAASISRNSGQICSTNSRVYVHESILDKFLPIYTKAYITAVKHGNPLDKDTTQGPLVDKIQFDKVMEFIETGKKEGKIAIGGNRKGNKGYFIEPTVFTETGDDAVINRQEIFGPVSIVHAFKTESEAIKRANDTEYGLTASVYTSNMDRAYRVALAIECGQVGINSPNQVATDMPYGGHKQSGVGRELGNEALDAFSEWKTIYVPYSTEAQD